MKSFLFSWFPVIAYCILIFIQSSHPPSGSIPEWPYVDKLLHFSGYALLGILFLRAFRTIRFKNNGKLTITLSITASSLYGLSDEIHQYFVPSRNADMIDIIADAAGSISGIIIYSLISGKIAKKPPDILSGNAEIPD